MSKQIKMMALSAIKPYENNPRKNDEAVEKVAESIKEFGFQQPIIVDGDKVIIAGHTRYKAAQSLCLDKVPVIVADELTEEQANAYRLADNKTAEFAGWDFELLDVELQGIEEIDMAAFGFNINNEWFTREEKEGKARTGNAEYDDFIDKFAEPKTTDDCYTPDNIYEVVADWVAETFKVKKSKFVRPFYPGGDYQNERYPKGSVVVDNPPFSIMREIIDFYVEIKQPFFLFAPGLVTLNYINREGVTAVITYAGIEYENGAKVATSFLTNCYQDDSKVVIDAALRNAIDEANKENTRGRELPKYEYPVEVLTAARAGWIAKNGESLVIRQKDCRFIRKLDAQDDGGIYGGAVLLSERAAAERAAAERAAAERAAAERAAAERFPLSDREKEIVKSLG